MKLRKLINTRHQRHFEGGDISEIDKGKDEGKFHPRIGQEGPEGE